MARARLHVNVGVLRVGVDGWVARAGTCTPIAPRRADYITAKPAAGTRFVKAFGLSTGFYMPMRAVAIYERDHAELALGVG